MAVFDLDRDGQPELITIEPFHGNHMGVHKRSADRTWQKVAERPLHFGHVVWAGDFADRPTLIVGNRGGPKDLYLLRARPTAPLESGGGPANIAIFSSTELLVANQAISQVALYRVSDGL